MRERAGTTSAGANAEVEHAKSSSATVSSMLSRPLCAPRWRRNGWERRRVPRGANPCDERMRGNALHAAHVLRV